MKTTIKLTLTLLLAAQLANAQNTFPANGSVGIGTLAPNSSAITEMVSTTKGLLIPRMTKNQRDAIGTPSTGLLIFQTNSNPGFYFFDGSSWKQVATGNGGANKTLSNLDPLTSINTSLKPQGAFSSNSLGDSTANWQRLYISNGIYYSNERVFNVDKASSNLSVGVNAGRVGANGVRETAIGFNVLGKSLGEENTGVGANALFDNTSGDFNVAVGTYSLFNNVTGSLNTAIGKSTLSANTTGRSNTAVGIRALSKNVDGNNLVAIGDSALYNQNGGSGKNTAIGSKALFANTTGNSNTATGFNSMRSNTTGVNNTANGVSAMFSNTDGINNTAMGMEALFSNTTGNGNTAVGVSAIYSNTTGSANTAIGSFSFTTNTTGIDNTALGSESLENNSTGNANTAAGKYALLFNTTGSNNVAIGASALELNNTANGSVAIGTATLAQSNISRQVAVGDSALYNLNGGSGFNTAVGNKALFASTTGQENAAFGSSSLRSATTGNFNAAFGTNSLTTNTTGNSNAAFGTNALSNATTASDNTAIGINALKNTTTGGSNTAVGRSALTSNTTGTFNTAIGYNANVSAVALTNATALGNGAIATASNQVMLGNNAVMEVRTFGTVIVPSDGRFKKNIKENVPGLEFIRALRPVTYNYDVHGLDNMMKTNLRKEKNTDQISDAEAEKAMSAKEKKIYTGFVAQEVEKTAEKFKYDFSGLYKPQNESDPYGLGYAEFVVPLVKAVQELAVKNDQLKSEIENLKSEKNTQQKTNTDLQKQIDELKTMLMANSTSAKNTQQLVLNSPAGAIEGASLSQNIPNPFSSYTVIKYHIPQQVKQAVMKITTADGKTVKTISISAKGSGQLHLETGPLAAGTYTYSLMADGKIVDTKSMVIIK